MAPGDAADAGTAVNVRSIRVQVAYSPTPERVDLVSLSLGDGAPVAEALAASGLLERHGLVLGEGLVCGVWAKIHPLEHRLRDGDRVEVYRPLRVDPKEARRQRYRKEGKRRAERQAAAPKGSSDNRGS